MAPRSSLVRCAAPSVFAARPTLASFRASKWWSRRRSPARARSFSGASPWGWANEASGKSRQEEGLSGTAFAEGEAAPVAEVVPRREVVLVLDSGPPTSQLITRRIREARVYCELVPGTTPWPELEARHPAALVLSRGPGRRRQARGPSDGP